MAYIPQSSIVAVQSNPSVLQVSPAPASVFVLNPVSVLSVNSAPASVQVLNPVSILATTQSGIAMTSIVSSTPSSVIVGASIFGQLPAGTAPLGSVATLQGTNPWVIVGSVYGAGSVVAFQPNPSVFQALVGLMSTSASVITAPITNQNVSGSVVSFQAGTQITSLVSTVPSSVIVGTSIFGQLPAGTAPLGSVATLQGTNPWITNINHSVATVIIGGSIAATFTPPANQSVSGTVQADIRASVAVVIIGGSVATATTNSSVMLLNSANVIGSVAALQGTNPWNIAGSVAAFQAGVRISSLVSTTPSSVQVGVSMMGIAPVTITANTVPASALAFLGATSSVTAGISSIITVTGYALAALQITSNPSMTATITFQGSADTLSWRPISGYNQETGAIASITTIADANWMFNVAGLQAFRALMPVWTAGSVTGKVYLSPVDARTFATHVDNVTPSSLLVGASIFGQLPAGTAPLGSVATLQGTNPWIVVGSVYGNISGSVAAFQAGTWSHSVMTLQITSIATVGQVMGSIAALQATNPWNIAGSVAAFVVGSSSIITRAADSSILAVPVGSTIVVIQSPSIVATYAEDAAHTSADKGIFALNVRNDTLASITSADLDYSPHAMGPAGEGIIAIAPYTKGIQGTGDLRVVQGTSVLVIAAQGASIFSYIRTVQVTNMGSASVLVTFGGGLGSILAYTIAPSGGGSNIKFDPWLKTGENSAFTASISAISSVLVSAQGFIAKI